MYIDIAVLIILIMFAIAGYQYGFFVQFISLFGLIGNFFLARHLTPIVIKMLKITQNDSDKMVYYAMLIILYVCLLIVTSLINLFFKAQRKSFLVRIGGIILSLAKGIVVSIIVASLLQLPWKHDLKLKTQLLDSKFIYYANKGMPYVYSYIPPEVRSKLDSVIKDEKVERYLKKQKK